MDPGRVVVEAAAAVGAMVEVGAHGAVEEVVDMVEVVRLPNVHVMVSFRLYIEKILMFSLGSWGGGSSGFGGGYSQDYGGGPMRSSGGPSGRPSPYGSNELPPSLCLFSLSHLLNIFAYMMRHAYA